MTTETLAAETLADYAVISNRYIDRWRLRTVSGVGPVCNASECAVIGYAMILEAGDYEALAAVCTPDDFHWRHLGVLFEVLIAKARRGEDLTDYLAVHDSIVAAGHDEVPEGTDRPWYALYVGCGDFVVSGQNSRWHAARVRDCAVKRRALADCKATAEAIGNPETSPSEIVGQMDATARMIEARTAESSAVSVADMAPDQYAEMLARIDRKHVGVMCGISSVDRETNGLQPDHLVILAGRPSTGKTALAFQWAAHAARSGVGVVAFSLEMPKEDLLNRMFALQASVSLFRVIHGRLGEAEMERYAAFLQAAADWPLYICDSAGSTPADVRVETQRLKSVHPEIGLVVIDYLQLMESGERRRGESREQEVAAISRRLKVLARDLKMPVLALAQLSRNVEQRGKDAKPVLSDLRESGAIEQDSDVVIFLHRTDAPAEKNQWIGKTLAIIAKHRNGPLGEIPLAFQADYTRFAAIAKAYPPPPRNLGSREPGD